MLFETNYWVETLLRHYMNKNIMSCSCLIVY